MPKKDGNVEKLPLLMEDLLFGRCIMPVILIFPKNMIDLFWVVVSNIFYFHPYLGKITILTNIYQRGWNHQRVLGFQEDRHKHLNISGNVALTRRLCWPSLTPGGTSLGIIVYVFFLLGIGLEHVGAVANSNACNTQNFYVVWYASTSYIVFLEGVVI